jgi:hypothetical protein
MSNLEARQAGDQKLWEVSDQDVSVTPIWVTQIVLKKITVHAEKMHFSSFSNCDGASIIFDLINGSGTSGSSF